MGLEDGDHPRRPGLRRGQGRANLLAVVRVVVHDVDVARRGPDQLEAAGDTREACEQAHDGIGVEPDLERDQRGGGGVLEVVESRLRDIQGQVAAAVPEDAAGPTRPDARDAQPRVGVLRNAIGRGLEPTAERRRLGAIRADEELSAVARECGELWP